jgi:hypothetical protein
MGFWCAPAILGRDVSIGKSNPPALPAWFSSRLAARRSAPQGRAAPRLPAWTPSLAHFSLPPVHAPGLWGGRVGRHRAAPGTWVAREGRQRGRPGPEAAGPGPAARRSAPQGRAAPRLPAWTPSLAHFSLPPVHAPGLWGGRVGRHRAAPGTWVARERRQRGRPGPEGTGPGGPQVRPTRPDSATAARPGRRAWPISASRRSTLPVCGADVSAATAQRPAHGWRVKGGSGAGRRPAGPPHKAGGGLDAELGPFQPSAGPRSRSVGRTCRPPEAAGPGPAARRSAPQGRAAPRLPAWTPSIGPIQPPAGPRSRSVGRTCRPPPRSARHMGGA